MCCKGGAGGGPGAGRAKRRYGFPSWVLWERLSQSPASSAAEAARTGVALRPLASSPATKNKATTTELTATNERTTAPGNERPLSMHHKPYESQQREQVRHSHPVEF